MILFTDGTMINHCFCYMTKGKQCKRLDCTGKKQLIKIKIKEIKK